MVLYKICFMPFKKVLIFIGFFTCAAKNTASAGYVINDTKEALKPVMQKLQDEFKTLKNEELQVSVMNNLQTSFKLMNWQMNPEKKLQELSLELNSQIELIHKALEKAKFDISMYNETSVVEHRQSLILPCKNISSSLSKDLLSKINESFYNDSSRSDVLQMLHNLFRDLWSIKSLLKQVYYLSLNEGLQFDHSHMNHQSCRVDNLLLWKVYMSHNTYRRRRLILLIEHGNSIEEDVLVLSKQFAKYMISVLNDEDKFTVIGVASKWSSLSVKEVCGNQNLPSILTATDNNKELTYNFIDGLSSMNEIADHITGMKIAMKMARLFYAGDETIMLLYISPGVEFSMSEALDIATVSDLSSPLVINSCSVSLGTLPDVQDINILSDIMNNFFIEKSKNKNRQVSSGGIIFINDQQKIGPAVTRLYEIYNRRLQQTTMKTSLPIWDPISQDLFISYTLGFPHENKFIVFGVDVYFKRFFRDIIYYSSYHKDMHAILMNFEGKVLIHPTIQLDKHEKQIKFTDISNYSYFNITREMFFKQPIGNQTSRNTTFIWKHIKNIYVICLVFENKKDESVVKSKVNWLPNLANSQLLSYLFELAGGTSSCKLLGKAVNIDATSLYLSQSCFQRFIPRINESLTFNILPYLQRENLLFKPEGLRDGIRDELANLIQVAEALRKKHITSINSEYIVRRYVATKSGILHIFPGTAIGSGFEPSKRFWFIRANELKDTLIVSPPYLDTGGAGYIVTLSFATRYFALGIDVTYGYVLKLILDNVPDCMNNNTCFLVDDRGYLISHPDLVRSLESDNEPVEQLHMVHKESSIANDFLNHEQLVQKLACNEFSSGTIQRYYQLNMSYTDILVSLVRGESCISYSIGALGGTNLFFGIVRAACPISRTFCPCSVMDRICLNCGNMEKQECECPCECQISRSSCSNYTSHDDYKICNRHLKGYSSEPVFNDVTLGEIDQCPNVNCDIKSDYLSCIGVIGCDWCQNDTYGFPIDTPFCAKMAVCFNGVLGGPSPYKDGNMEVVTIFSSFKNTVFILGLIIAFGVVFIVVFVCWRSYNTPRSQRVYLSARQEEHLHMSDLNINDDFLEQGNHSDKLLIDDKKGAPISPYCVTSNYSRPTTAADSDHGYSTMTPHDESEHLSLAPVEIDSLEEDVASDRTTPPSRHKVLLTKLPHKNCIIVPVTVHRHVDAT